MAIAYQSSQTAVGLVQDLTCTKPTSTASGDLLVAMWNVRGTQTDAQMTLPTGWTKVIYQLCGTNSPAMKLAYKVAGASEPDDYTFSLNAASNQGVIISRFTGQHATTVSDVAASGNYDSSGTDASAEGTAITTATDGAMVIYGAGAGGVTISYTPPDGMTEAAETASVSRVELAYVAQATAGTTGTKTATLSDNNRWVALVWAIRPAATAVNGSVSAVAATASAAAQAATLTAGASVSGVAAASPAAASAPGVTASANVTGVTAAASAASPAPAVSATGILVDIDHEAGDLSEYSGSEGTVSATAGAALAGTSYGLALEITEGSGGGAWTLFDPPITPEVLRARVYLDPNGLTMADGDEVDVMYLKPGFLYLVKSGSNYAVKVLYATDDSSGATDLAVITDAPHYIEVQFERASAELATDGTCQIWIDGTSADSVTGIANYSVFIDTDGAALGQSSGAGATVSGTLYLDEFIVNNTGAEIGPAQGDASVAATAATATAAAPAPAVSGAAGVTGVTASATAAAQPPAVSGGASITGATAQAGAAGIAPAISAGAGVAGATTAASAAAPAPGVTAGASVTATAAETGAQAHAPGLSAGVTISAVTATATAEASAPIVSASGSVTVYAVTATAAVASPAASVTAGAGVTGSAAASTAQAHAPGLSAGAGVSATSGAADAAAIPPSVSTAGSATVYAVTATAAAGFSAPSISAAASITAAACEAVADASAPSVGVWVSVLAVAASATAGAGTPTVSAGVGISPPAAAAAAALLAPFVYAPPAAIFYWTLAPRALALALQRRSLEASLNERETPLTIAAREFAGRLNERSTALTLEDR